MRKENPHIRSRRRGFSLIEVLFAVFLLGVGASIITATMPMSNNARARADMQNKAVGLAQKELESIRGLGYANVSPTQLYTASLIDSTTSVGTNTYSFTNVDTASRDNPARLLPSGTGTVTIEQADLDLRQVTVTITWVERGTTRTYTVGTLVANL